MGEQLEREASGGTRTLGATFVFSLAVSLWSANAGMKALFDALNIVYSATESRGLVKLNAVSLAFTAGALLIAAFAVAAFIVLPVALQYIGLGGLLDWIIKIGRWPVLY